MVTNTENTIKTKCIIICGLKEKVRLYKPYKEEVASRNDVVTMISQAVKYFAKDMKIRQKYIAMNCLVFFAAYPIA